MLMFHSNIKEDYERKRNIYCLKALAVAAVSICFTGCSDDFLKDKKVYGSYDSSVVYENYETARSRVDYLYQCLLPSATGGSNALTDVVSAGVDDDFLNVRKNMEVILYSIIHRKFLPYRLFPTIFMLSTVKQVLGAYPRMQ